MYMAAGAERWLMHEGGEEITGPTDRDSHPCRWTQRVNVSGFRRGWKSDFLRKYPNFLTNQDTEHFLQTL